MVVRMTLTALLVGITFLTPSFSPAEVPDRIVVMPIEFTDPSLESGVVVIEEIIAKYFKDSRSVLIISNEQEESLAGSVTGNRLDLIRSVTAKMAGNLALIFTLSRYQERVGDNYSAEDPASLAFEFKLINAGDGAVICSGSYDESQKSLTENILELPRAIKRGFKWLTVEQLAREVILERFDDCPTLTAATTR